MKIYKYLNLEKEYNWKNLYRIIRNNKFWFSNFLNLNDPCDGKPILHFDIDPETFSERLINLKKIDDKKLTPFDLSMKDATFRLPANEIRILTQDNYNKFIKPHYENVFLDATKFVGISCFSRVPNDPVMWSHYANNHKGICIEMSINPEKFVEELDRQNGIATNIKYQSERPIIKMSSMINEYGVDFSFTAEIIYAMYFIKGLSWKQEAEFRISRLSDIEKGEWTGRYIDIPSIQIENLIFGLNTDRNIVDKISYDAKKYNLGVKFAKYSDKSFLLDIK